MINEIRDYLILDVESCPNNLKGYDTLSEEDKLKLLNPIDSRIVALGVRHKGEDTIILAGDEKKMLEEFWILWKKKMMGDPTLKVVGFNIKEFDIPFIVTRSFINDVEVFPFTLNKIIDIREKISAYRWGRTRGRLKEYAALIGVEDLGIDGSDVAGLCAKGEFETLRKYLLNDLLITDKMFQRLLKTKIAYITHK